MKNSSKKSDVNERSTSLIFKLRELDNLSAKLNKEVLKFKGKVDELVSQIKSDLDSTSDMRQTERLRIQMAAERRSKFASDLNNILKKFSDTSDSIVQNMK